MLPATAQRPSILRLLFCLAIFWPQVLLGQASPKQTIYALLQSGEFQKAESAARNYIETSPQDCSGHIMLGLALRGEHRLTPAYDEFLSATKLCPQSVAALEGAAEIAYSTRRADAENLLTKLLELRPSEQTASAMLGALEAQRGDCAGAVEHYGDAGAELHQSPAALRQYARCLLMLGRASDAAEQLTGLLRMQESPPNRKALARAQLTAGRRADALATLAPLVSAESRDDQALLLGAQAAEAGNDTPRAIAWLRQAIEVAPRNVENYLYFAEISFNHGSYQVGIDFVNLGLREAPENARLYLARGVLEVQLGKMDAAVSDFENSHKLDPRLSLAEDALGVLFSQKHDLSAALTLFEKKSKEQPDDPLLQYLYAEALSESSEADSERLSHAIEAARRALSLEPGYQPARDLLCVLLLRHGDFQAVVDEAAEATRREPYDEVALYQALLAERRLKHTERITELVRQLQLAKSHNQVAVTKYVLQDAEPPQGK